MSDDDRAPASSEDERHVGPGGVRAGDFLIRAAPAFATSAEHDSLRNQERADRARDDARAAQVSGVVQRPASLPGLAHSPPPAAPRSELDEALDEARAEAAGAEEVPIFVRDPVTGLQIKAG